MCEFCTKHGEGRIWYKNAANYGQDLLSDLKRRHYIENFLGSAFGDGFETLGRLETIYRKKGKLPRAVSEAMLAKARAEHFGQVLPIEEIGYVVGQARTVVRMPCACRWKIGKKEERCCYAISYGPEAWYRGIDMSYFGKASDEGLEPLTPAEAIPRLGIPAPAGDGKRFRATSTRSVARKQFRPTLERSALRKRRVQAGGRVVCGSLRLLPEGLHSTR